MMIALDVTDACESLERRLGSWDQWVEILTESSHRYLPARDPEKNCIPVYWMDQAYAEKRSEYDPYGYRYRDRDERPYFKDPAPLVFVPEEAFARDDGKGEEGVLLADVWKDPLARTIWLAVKARHLTSQYFRGGCINQAKWLREKPPMTSDDLHVGTGEGFGNCGRWFQVQLYPYIVRVLMDEGLWPYLHPGRVNVSPHVLGYQTP